MNPWEIAGIVVGVLIVFGAVMIGAMYNKLVTLRNRLKNGYAQIDVQLKRRYDLIPNLVETAKGYMKHEKEVLENITKARGAAMQACHAITGNLATGPAMAGLIGAENNLMGLLGQMRVALEAYPDLKADQHMSQLMEELASTENRIAFARQAYNDAVMVYNTGRESFPTVMFAGSFGFLEAPLFEINDPGERAAVKVSVS